MTRDAQAYIEKAWREDRRNAKSNATIDMFVK